MTEVVTVFETDYYAVEVNALHSFDTFGNRSAGSYAIRNKQTKVIEGMEQMLHVAIEGAKKLTEMLEAVEKQNIVVLHKVD